MTERVTRAIATSDSRASEAGAEILRGGGNPVDAAVTAAFVLMVTEPHACGIAGDAFLMLHDSRHDGPGPPRALDGAGAVPAALTDEALRRDGFDEVPVLGAQSVSVPGAPALLCDALSRFGTIAVSDAVAPAVRLAREGFAVRPTLEAAIARMAGVLADDPVLSPLYVPDGRALRTGDVIVNAALASALEQLAAEGSSAFYRGFLATAMVEGLARRGGYLTAADLAAHETLPMTPISTTFCGHEVWELPAPTQGYVVLAALAALERKGTFDDQSVTEALVEGFDEAGMSLDRLRQNAVTANGQARGDTTYIAAAEAHGQAVSLITSVYCDFGSCVGIEALGGPVHNRASAYSFVHEPVRPGKPPHTTIPAMVTTQDSLQRYALGVVGGYMQAQGQVQLLTHLLAGGLTPQEAIDRPRVRMLGSTEMALEPGHPLAARHPEAVGRSPGSGGFGGAQIVSSNGREVWGASDRRRGGAAIALP